MAYIATPRRSRKWNTRWNPDVLKGELRKKDRSILQICRDYSTRKLGWQAFYGDIQRWRKVDMELAKLIEEHKDSVMGDSRGRGRLANDVKEEDLDWMLRFCEEYLKEKNKAKAALVTPYKASSIISMLNPKDSSYNAKFASMVDSIDAQFLEMAKELALKAADAARTDPNISIKDKAWIGLNIAKVAKGTDWNQQKVDINIAGHLKFEAQRAKTIQELVAEQRAHFEKSRAPLLLEEDNANVIELEPLPEKDLVES